jgi:hypothetical protein
VLDDAGRKVRAVGRSPAQGDEPLSGLLRGFPENDGAQHELEHGAFELVVRRPLPLGFTLDHGLSDPTAATVLQGRMSPHIPQSRQEGQGPGLRYRLDPMLVEHGVGVIQAVAITRALLGWDETSLRVAIDIVAASAARATGAPAG